MKKLSQLTILLALVLGYSTQSHAGLLIEPVIGYSFGNTNVDVEVPSNAAFNSSDKNSVKGTSYGGRLGYQNFGFQLGLDYLASAMETDGDKFKTSEFGGFVGFEFPILIRVYAGYVFSGTGTLESDKDYKFKSGTGPKVGIGFTLLPFLDINLEYRSIKYEELETTSSNSTPININADYNAVMLGFSLPFVL